MMEISSSPWASLLVTILVLLLVCAVVFFYYWQRHQKSLAKNQKLLVFKSQRELESNLHSIITDLAQLCKDNPKLTHPYLILGNLYRLVGEVQRSVVIHQNLLTDEKLSRPMSDRARIELANDLVVMGMEEQALAQLQEVEQRSQLYLLAQEKMVDLYFKRRLFDKAYECMQPILSRKRTWRNRKRSAYYLTMQAEKILERGDLPEAKKTLKRALEIDSECIMALYLEGNIAVEEREYDNAIERYTSILQINPDFAFLAIPRIEDAYYGKQSFMRFGESLQAISQRFPNNSFIAYSLGKYLRKRKQYAEAKKALTQALENNKTFVLARDEMHQIHNEENHLEYSIADYEEMLEEMKQQSHFVCSYCHTKHTELLWTCFSCGRWETIHADLTLYPNRPHVEESSTPELQASHS